MFTIKTLNAISPVGLAKLNKNLFDVSVGTDAPDGILVRSADLLNTTFNDNLLAIARAGAGVNNIPLDRCSEQGIVVFNTPGANANAVAELVIGMLIAGSRNVAAAAQWCQGLTGDPAMAKTVEKGKKKFVGNEIKGKTLGVIGLGAIGSRVANCAIELGMEVYGYDPYISIDAAWNLSSQVHHCVNLNDMLPLCDYITIHVPYLPTTKDTINAQTLALCKDGVKILNYARGELVNTAALLEAMEERQVSVDGVTYPLAPPFMVLATQNPVETETTFALPAAQLDRFLFKLSMGYPTPREEAAMLRTVGDGAAFADLRPLLSPEEVNRFTGEIRQVRLSDPVVAYIVELVQATREQPELACGASPRVSRDLFRASKAYAALSGRDYVTPDDVKYLARYVLPHRVLLSHQAALSGLEAAGVVETVLAQVPCRETGEVLAHGQNA